MGMGARFDYALEVKNTGLASRPDAWSLAETGFEHPAYSARVGFRPDLRWTFGLSASDSAYLLAKANGMLPTGRGRGDYRQRLWGQDLSFAWHHVQVWAEFFQSSFDVPRIGRARTQAGYVETKVKLTPAFYTALRINRQVFSKVALPGTTTRWGENLWRLDAAAGCRLTPFALLKIQVSSEQPDRAAQRTNLALQFTFRF